jgi:hypothetical protein
MTGKLENALCAMKAPLESVRDAQSSLDAALRVSAATLSPPGVRRGATEKRESSHSRRLRLPNMTTSLLEQQRSTRSQRESQPKTTLRSLSGRAFPTTEPKE